MLAFLLKLQLVFAKKIIIIFEKNAPVVSAFFFQKSQKIVIIKSTPALFYVHTYNLNLVSFGLNVTNLETANQNF
jgi:hypothetical protein